MSNAVGDGQMLQQDCRAKINLYLNVIERGADGYHEIETLFQEIDLADKLEWTPGRAPLTLDVRNADLGKPEENLVLKAADQFARITGRQPGGRVTLHKNIPAGGGLGGGSSDAAGMVRLLNRHYGAPLDRAAMISLCANLGSDVPFFLEGGCRKGKGRGVDLSPPEAPPDCVRQGFLFFPPLALATADVYRACRPAGRQQPQVIGRNDLLEAALHVSDQFAEIWAEMIAIFGGDLFMTGSGSTVVWLTEESGLTASQVEVLENQGVSHAPFRFY